MERNHTIRDLKAENEEERLTVRVEESESGGE